VTLDDFQGSQRGNTPPSGLSLALVALWWDGKDDWAKAHESAQQDESLAGAWVHAYLHRKEQDASNATYWYQRAGKSPSTKSLSEEWTEITRSLLAG
jgi:hypothetical protein